ncbi:MAG: DegT/DnrJ/EryC1/StrS family aminotransferase [Candidatus Eisenbacteria bacterium]|nr:DegT/DnrJ/EryC1/StrS family aminotransferase [Candidatus Eisenbacteria bacterium]
MDERLAIDGGKPVRDSFLIFGSPDIREAEIQEVVDTLRSGWPGTGPRVARFEEAFRAYIGSRHAVALNSCTAGLHLSMIALGVKPGDEVITTPLTFVATVNAIVHVGATPVLADCDRRTMNIDPNAIASRITDRTRAIVPVHFAGRPAEMTAIEAIARPRGIRILEDAAHAVEARHGTRKVGTIGDCTVFSFYVNKNMMTVEGGMVTTDDDEIASWVKIAGLHGMSKDAWKRFGDEGYKHYAVHFPGFKYNMTDIQAAIGLHQLARVEAGWIRRQEIWNRYQAGLTGLPAFLPPPPDAGDRHAYHLFTLLVDLENLTASRDRILGALQAENIGVGVHYSAIHLHPYYRDAYGFARGDYPSAEFVSDRTLSIPFSTKLTDGDVDDVIGAVRKVLTAYAR